MKPITFIDWDRRFARSATRKCEDLHWFAMPVAFDPLMMRRIAREPNPCEIIACLTLMLQVAAAAPRAQRGSVVDSRGNAMTTADLDLLTGIPATAFDHAIRFLSQPAVGLIVVDTLTADCQPATNPLPADYQPSGSVVVPRVEGEKKEKKEETESSVPSAHSACEPAPTSEGFALALEEPSKPKRKPTVAQKPPTLEEWLAYAATLTPAFPPLEAEGAYANYEAKDWTIGKVGAPAKNWRALVRTCHVTWRKNGCPAPGAAPKPRHRPEWVVEKELRETEAELKFLRDQIDYRFGDDLSRLPASLRPRWDRAKAKESSLLDELDAIQNASPAPSRAVS